MNRGTNPWAVTCGLALLGLSPFAGAAARQRTQTASPPKQISGVAIPKILARLGARLEQGTSSQTLRGYTVQFDRTDPNRDGKHSRQEYVNNGRYLTPQARAGIFRAADGNADGVVTRSEYVLNRIITDEAKAIVEAMDENENRQIERAEFIEHATRLVSDRGLAVAIYAALDVNHDGRLLTPEYLRVWGQWARFGRPPAEQRIAARRTALAKTVGSAPPGNNRRPVGPTGRPAPPSVDQVFRRFDANRDDTLTRDEVPAFVQQFIFPADANRNGKVTKGELKQFRQTQPPNREPSPNVQTERDGPPNEPPRRSRSAEDRPSNSPGRGRGRGGGNPDQFVQRALQFDANGDGKLDRQELLDFAQSMTRRRGGDRFRRRRDDNAGGRGRERRPGSERPPPRSENQEPTKP